MRMDPAALLATVVQQIKVTAGAPGTTIESAVVEPQKGEDNAAESTETTGTTPNEDELLETMGKPYRDLLLFLWTLHHRGSDIKPPTTGAIEDGETAKWLDETWTWLAMPPPPLPPPTGVLHLRPPHHLSSPSPSFMGPQLVVAFCGGFYQLPELSLPLLRPRAYSVTALTTAYGRTPSPTLNHRPRAYSIAA